MSNDNDKKEENKDQKLENAPEEKKFCADCGFEYKIGQMLKRRDGKYFCYRCAPRNQL